MCNRAEQFALTLYTPWSEDGMSRKDNTEVIEACIKGYEQAEKDTIARAVKWLTIYQGKDLDYLTGESIELFKEAMEKEDEK